MALQSSGQISFSQIADEFGVPSGNRLGSYRVVESVGSLSNLPLDSGIPQSGQIRFTDFYSKRLNIVVDCHSGSTEFRVNARVKYSNNNLRVVGGFRGAPSSGSGKKIFINVNKTFGSASGSTSNVGNDQASSYAFPDQYLIVCSRRMLHVQGKHGSNWSKHDLLECLYPF